MEDKEKTKIRVIKKANPGTIAPAPAAPSAPAAEGQKKVVVIKKKIVTVKARVKEDRKEEAAEAAPAPVQPAAGEGAPAKTPDAKSSASVRPATSPAARQDKPLVQPATSRHAAPSSQASMSGIPAANRNIIGGERIKSSVHNGPIVIKSGDLPPVPGQIVSGTPTSSRPRVAGVVGGRSNDRERGGFRSRDGQRGGYQGGYQGGQRQGWQGGQQTGGFRRFNGNGQQVGFNRAGGQNGPIGGRPTYNRPGGRPGMGGAPASGSGMDLNQKTAARKGVGRRKEGGDYRSRRDQEVDFQYQQKKKEESKLAAVPKSIDIMENITVSDLAKKMNLKASDIISKLFKMGMMVTINQQIDHETAEIIANEFGCEVHLVSLYDETVIEDEADREEDMVPRAPIVTIMGHVDHGKTKLLDAIRSSDVAGGEFGGITQHIGAYKVNVPGRGDVVFLDTPGHAAFSMMRARGAQVTDIVVLVVAANDGVMPQTREAIDHARAANVPIIVAINKCDLADANPERVMQQLSDIGLVPEEWGGQTLYCRISALKKEGIDDLLDTILLQAEMLELKANPKCRAVGKILESRIDQGRGTVATVIVQKGTLHQGDYYVAGIYPGRVRAMFDDKGQRIQSAGPSTPVEIIGLSDIPSAGDPFQVTEDEKQARMVGAKRQELERLGNSASANKITLENLYDKIREGEIKDFNVIIKGDVQGSVEALQGTLQKLSTDEIRLNVIRASAGAIIESDITLAAASNALVIGFNVRPTPRAQALAEQEKVEIRKYNIIYDVVDDIKAAMEGMLSPEIREIDCGKAEVREVFRVPKVGLVAGVYILEGKVTRSCYVRVVRDSIQINKDNIRIASLKRFKDDAKEVTAGYECGIGLEDFQDIQKGDTLEFVQMQEVARKLEFDV